jgi:hypothetical protein
VSGVQIRPDFDNSIICCDGVFAAAARRRGLVAEAWIGRNIDARCEVLTTSADIRRELFAS